MDSKTGTVYLGTIGRVYAAPKHTTGSFAQAKENIWWDYQNQTDITGNKCNLR